MSDLTILTLDDGVKRRVKLPLLERTAAELPDGDGSRLEVRIGNRNVEAMPLLATALRLTPEDLRPSQARRVFNDLGIPLVGEQNSTTVSAEDRPSLPSKPRLESEDETDLTFELLKRLQRHQGNWVAVHRGDILAVDATLSTLLKHAANKDATVLFVPPASETGGDA